MKLEAQLTGLKQRQETVDAELSKGGRLAALESKFADLAEQLKPIHAENDQISARVLAAENALLAATEADGCARTQIRDLRSRLDGERKRLEEAETSLRQELKCVEAHTSTALQRMREA